MREKENMPAGFLPARSRVFRRALKVNQGDLSQKYPV
jgi:hypothetical protein